MRWGVAEVLQGKLGESRMVIERGRGRALFVPDSGSLVLLVLVYFSWLTRFAQLAPADRRRSHGGGAGESRHWLQKYAYLGT